MAEGEDAGKTDRAYRLALSRPPTGAERERPVKFVKAFAARSGAREAWFAFCQALFGTAEFRYLD
jgi:hypothetical protein